MKILLDECVTKRVRRFINAHDPNIEVWTVTQMQWNGLRNGKLMSQAVGKHFDILLTIDKNLSFQQNLQRFDLSVVVLDAVSSNIADIAPLLPAFLEKLKDFQKHQAYLIS